MFEKKKSVLLFLLPGLCMLLIFYIIPFFSGIGYSLMDGSSKNEFVGLKNYREIWQNSMFLLGLKNTMELSLICAPLLWILSFLLASALASIKPFGGFFRSSVLLPYLTPSSAILLVWLVLFDYGGPVNRALAAMGAERVMWLSSGALRLPVVLMFLWKNLGFCLIIFLAALQQVPQDLYEAAEIDGCGAWKKFLNVTLPGIRGTVLFVLIELTIGGFNVFTSIKMITGGKPAHQTDTLLTWMYYKAFSTGKFSYAAALSFVMALTLGLLAIVQFRAMKSRDE